MSTGVTINVHVTPAGVAMTTGVQDAGRIDLAAPAPPEEGEFEGITGSDIAAPAPPASAAGVETVTVDEPPAPPPPSVERVLATAESAPTAGSAPESASRPPAPPDYDAGPEPRAAAGKSNKSASKGSQGRAKK